MRNLKRALSLVLVIAMVCSLMVIGVGAVSASEFTDYKEVKNSEAVSVLVELGIVNGKPAADGSYYYDGNGTLTRAEAAKLLSVILNGGKVPTIGTPETLTYTDVAANYWGAGFIEYCTAIDIVAGVGGGKFAPEASLTATQLSKMLLVALNYDAAYEGLVGGSWDAKTDVLANQNNFYNGLDASFVPNVAVTRDNAAQIIYNALSANTVLYRSAGEDGKVGITTTKDATLLAKYFGVTKYEGVIVANEVADLKDNAVLAKNRTEMVVQIVDNVVTNDWIANDYDVAAVLANRNGRVFNVASGEEVIGRNATILYKAATREVIGGVIVNASNNVAVVEAGATIADTATAAGLTLSGVSAANNAVVVDDDDTRIFTNYDASVPTGAENSTSWRVAYWTAADTTVGQNTLKATATLKGATVTLVDFDDNGVVDFIFNVLPTLDRVLNVGTSDVTFQSTGKVSNTNVLGALEGIAKGDIVFVTAIDGTYYYAAPATVKGKVTSYVDAYTKLVSGGTTYATSDVNYVGGGAELTDMSASSMANMDYTSEYEFYLDGGNNIVAFDVVNAAAAKYALITNVGSNKTTWSTQYVVKAVLADSTTAVEYVVDYKDTDMVNVLENNTNAYASINAFAKEAKNLQQTPNDYAPVLVSYKINADGEMIITGVASTANATALTKGQTKVDNAYANSATVYFYVYKSDNKGAAADWTVQTIATGVANSLKVDTAVIDLITAANQTSNQTAVKAALVLTANSLTTSTAKYAYIYKVYASEEKFATYNAIFSDGTTGTVKVKETADNNRLNAFFKVTEDADGVAQLTAATSAENAVYDAAFGTDAYVVESDVVDYAKGTLVVTQGASVQVNADLTLYRLSGTTLKTDGIINREDQNGKPVYTYENDTNDVKVLYDKDGNALIIVTEWYQSQANVIVNAQ